MTGAELHDMMDTYLNTYEVGFMRDPYQKSLYLTRAQDIYYDTILANFEDTNTISEKIDKLVSAISITSFTNDLYGGFVAEFPEYVRKVLREKVVYSNDQDTASYYRGDSMQVREERLAEIESSLENPFRTPGEHYVLRAVQESTTFNKVSLYIPAVAKIANYIVTLATEPKPIIIEDLPDGLTIRDESTETTDFEFKDKDLEKIVELAVSLILKDASAFGDRARQGVEAVGEGTSETAINDALDKFNAKAENTQKRQKADTSREVQIPEHILSALSAKIEASPVRVKQAREHANFGGEKVLGAMDVVAANTPKTAKQASEHSTMDGEKVLSAMDAIAANTPRKDKVADENKPLNTEYTLSALEQQLLSQPKK